MFQFLFNGKRPHAIAAWHKKWDEIADETYEGDKDALGPPKEKR